jgi:proline iminopeptidase
MEEKTMVFKEGFIKNNQVELYYKIMGKGKPIVIVHGGPGFDHNSMLPMSELAREAKVIFYDQRATGNSTGEANSDSITVDHFVQDLEQLRKQLKLKKINLIGHSWGSTLAMFYGIKYADHLESLILMAPSGASIEYFDRYFENIQKKTSPEDKRVIAQIEASTAFKNKDIDAFKKYYRISVKTFFYDQSLTGKLNLNLGKNTVKNQLEVSNLLMKNLGNFDIHEQLSAIKCPTLILHGDSDPLPFEMSYKIHKHISQSKLVVLKNTGHFMFIESPDKLFSTIRDFLRDEESVKTSIPADMKKKVMEEF